MILLMYNLLYQNIVGRNRLECFVFVFGIGSCGALIMSDIKK